jgi:hypothetical protein
MNQPYSDCQELPALLLSEHAGFRLARHLCREWREMGLVAHRSSLPVAPALRAQLDPAQPNEDSR